MNNMSLKNKYDYVIIRNNQALWFGRCAYDYVLKLERENQQLKIKYATEILKQKEITTFINWGDIPLNELDERIHDLIKLSEEIGGKSELYKRI